MNEYHLKFCLNAIVQLLDEWGCNFFSWEKIFKDEEENSEIDFKKYIKNEDFLDSFSRILSNPDTESVIQSFNNPESEFNNMLQGNDLSGINSTTLQEMGRIFTNFVRNNGTSLILTGKLTDESEAFINVNVVNMLKQIDKKYVFNTIFEIVKTEGRKKIFMYTFSEAAKIMRSS